MGEAVRRARLEALGAWAVEWYEERAAIREYDGGMERGEAERAAWRDALREAERRKCLDSRRAR
jgi:hypothetical protein